MNLQETEIEPGYYTSNTKIRNLAPFGDIVFGRINSGMLQIEKCAVKIMLKRREVDQQRELKILQNIHQNNIIKTYKIIEKDNKIYIFKEFQDYKTLFQLLQRLKGRPAAEDIVIHIAAQLINCFNYLISQGIVNRDISLHNILLTNDMTPKVFDFGNSKVEESFECLQSQNVGGDIFYMSPQNLGFNQVQIVDQVDYEKNDVWSFGITLFMLSEGDFPWFKNLVPGDSNALEREILALKQIGITFRETKNQSLQNLIKMMLTIDQTTRPTFSELVQVEVIKKQLHKIYEIEQELFQQAELYKNFKLIKENLKLDQILENIVYQQLIRDFSIHKDQINQGTNLHEIYKELLEFQIMSNQQLWSELELRLTLQEVQNSFLKKIYQKVKITEYEYQLFSIMLKLQGHGKKQLTESQKEIIEEIEKQCKGKK